MCPLHPEVQVPGWWQNILLGVKGSVIPGLWPWDWMTKHDPELREGKCHNIPPHQ